MCAYIGEPPEVRSISLKRVKEILESSSPGSPDPCVSDEDYDLGELLRNKSFVPIIDEQYPHSNITLDDT